MPNDECRRRAGNSQPPFMQTAFRASDFDIPSTLGISSFVIVHRAQRLEVALSI